MIFFKIPNIFHKKLAIITFSSFGLFFFFLFLTKYFDKNFVIWKITIYYSLIPAYIFFGIFAATMGLLWFIGSAYFCKNDEVADYQSIHLYFTGFRGLFAPLLGIYFYLLIDYNGVFLMGIGFIVLTVFIMMWSLRKHKIKNL